MKLDEVMRQAFERELAEAPPRRPSLGEASRAAALVGSAPRRPARERRLLFADVAPILAMAAAAFVVSLSGFPPMRWGRPLANELAVSMPEDASLRFLDFVLEAGESYRSAD